ncbi:MAG: SET domain-containing protein-lysine N-methyltransferase [Gemmatimonadaceae bacterium]|nr:SET domain-containing protein-lysine N-methyltransferase [Gemmatimonadaceae bacterium]
MVPTTLPFDMRDSPIHGRGAFARRAIPAGTRLIEYAGRRRTPAEAEALYPDDDTAGPHTFLFAIDDDIIVDAGVDGNEARWLNHSCDPNCDVVVEDQRLWIETVRDVRRGEELTYDYQMVLKTRHTPAAKKRFPCACGAATCRGTMLARKR